MDYFFNSYITINTKLGKVKGIKKYINNKNLFIYYQIPYATPPIKSLRWKKPLINEKKYNGILDATCYNKISNQHLYFYYKYYNNISYNYFIKKFKHKQTEDCLYLDIYSPVIERKNLPVIIVIHGGHFQYGYSKNMKPNLENIVNNNVIYVTINYRLGIYGFFQHPELKKENKYNSCGNYGIMDIICAIKWIKNNIYWYGGDSNNITLQGQGSGANIILYLMCNDNCIDDSLFNKVILHSASKMYNLCSKENESIETGDILVGQGKNQIYRLRNLNEEIINEYYNSIKNFDKLFMPSIDFNIIHNHSIYYFNKGIHMKIPMIIGYNFDDGYLLYNTPLKKLITNPKNNKNYSDEDKENLNNIYNNINKNNNKSILRYYTDYLFTHFNRLIANNHKKYANTYFYVLKNIDIYNINIFCCFELDLFYFFDNNSCNNVNIDIKIKKKILKYISNFAYKSDPNDKKINKKKIVWKEYSSNLAIYFNKEIYTNFLNEYDSLNIMDREYIFDKTNKCKKIEIIIDDDI